MRPRNPRPNRPSNVCAAGTRRRVKPRSTWCRTVFGFGPPSERNGPFRVDKHGRGYRKAYAMGSCGSVAQHRGVDRMFQRRTCRVLDLDDCCLTRTAHPLPDQSPRRAFSGHQRSSNASSRQTRSRAFRSPAAARAAASTVSAVNAPCCSRPARRRRCWSCVRAEGSARHRSIADHQAATFYAPKSGAT